MEILNFSDIEVGDTLSLKTDPNKVMIVEEITDEAIYCDSWILFQRDLPDVVKVED